MARFGLPSIISQIPNDLRQFLDRVREFIDAATGGDSQLVSRSGLIEAGIAVPGPGNSLLPSAPPSSDTTPPPAPAGLTASGTLTSIYLTWDLPAYTNHSYTKIWRALTDNFSNAVVIGSRAGAVRIFADSVGMGASYYYWIQHVSKADVPGPVVGTGTGQQGVYAYTATDNTAILTLLENALTGTHIQANAISSSELQALAVSTAHIQANAITSAQLQALAVSTAHIQENAITSAQLQALAVSTAHIQANAITSAHILAGSILAGHIQANEITAAHIQANAIASVHILAGSILAAHIQANAITAAQIQAGSITGDRIAAGAIIASHLSVTDLSAVSANMGNLTAGTITLDQSGFIRSGNIAYASGIGFWMGYTGGAYKFYLGNPAGGYLDWNGSLLRIGGSAEFSGSLSGATGTFSGSLSAATGTFGGSVTGTGVIGTDQIQDYALTAPKIAALQVQAGHMAANSITAGNAAIADATVTNAKIVDATIQGAKIADLAVDTAKINDLAVSTLKIQNQAVTIPVSSYTSTSLSIYSGNVQSLSITAIAGAPIFVSASLVGGSVDGGVHSTQIRITRNGVVIFQDDSNKNEFTWSVGVSDLPGAGTHTYAIYFNGLGYEYSVLNRSLLAIQTKK